MDERGRKLAAANAQSLERARTETTYGWDAIFESRMMPLLHPEDGIGERET